MAGKKQTEGVVEPDSPFMTMLSIDMSLLGKAQVIEHRGFERLVVGLQKGAWFRSPVDVLRLHRNADGIQCLAAEDAIVRPARRLVDVELVVAAGQRGRIAGEQIAIGLTLGQVPKGIGVVPIDLMIDAADEVSAVQAAVEAPVEVRSC